MRLSSLSGAVLALSLFATACGESNDKGGGTRTLYVEAFAQTDGSINGTSVVVGVRDGSPQGAILSDAVVVFRGEKNGEFSLPWQGLAFGDFRSGAYVRTALPWDSGWQIEVTRGEDHLDAFLKVPGFTTITQPIGGTTFSRTAGRPLVVRWADSEEQEAMRVEVKLKKADQRRELGEDPFELAFDAGLLRVEDKEEVEVRRSSELALNGGVPGSLFRATSRHSLEFRVE